MQSASICKFNEKNPNSLKFRYEYCFLYSLQATFITINPKLLLILKGYKSYINLINF